MLVAGNSTQVEETFTPIPLEQLQWWWVTDVMPVFVATVPDIMKHIEAHGFSIYYVIATEKYLVKVNDNYNKPEKRPQVFKVMKSIVGKSITAADDELKMDEIECSAWFTLPKIPYHLITMMDDFFRLIEDELHTESIVLLTYDSTKSGPEGWGVLVPNQKNTSADCDYDPASIADDKPDHVYIVGSAHSHPGMSAYASGTDHKDQANFDGIHITFGWMKSKNNGLTEYHIELQYGGKSFQFNADQVFEAFPTREPSEDVKEWATKVEKKSYASHNGGKTSTHTTGYTQPGTSSPLKKVEVPVGCPDPRMNVVIGEVKASDKNCPFCKEFLISVDRDKRRCMACHQYIAVEGDTLTDVIDARMSNGVYSADIDVVKGNPTKTIYMWVRLPDGTSRYDKLYEPSGK